MRKVGIIIIGFILWGQSFGFAGETVRLANGEWAPYYSQNLKHYGIGSRIVSEAFALEGIKVEYGFFPWKRAFNIARNGEWDGVVGFETNSEREPHFYASDDLWVAPWVFFHLKTYPFGWETMDDLKGIKIGGTLEYMYTPEFLDAERSGMLDVEREPTDQMGFKKLLAGRIALFPQIVAIGYYQLQEMFDPGTVKLFTHHPKPFGAHTEQLLLTKKHERSKHLVQIFNRGLQHLKDSGQYEQFLESYLIPRRYQ